MPPTWAPTLLLFLLLPLLACGAPGRSRMSSVSLNGRAKEHGGAPEVCPQRLNYCKCRSRGIGLDITCENINGYKLAVR